MDTSPSEKVSFPVFSNISVLDGELSELADVSEWLAKASDGYSGEKIIKKLQQTKYDRVIKVTGSIFLLNITIKTVIADGMHNLLLNQYTTMILPNFRDEGMFLLAF